MLNKYPPLVKLGAGNGKLLKLKLAFNALNAYLGLIIINMLVPLYFTLNGTPLLNNALIKLLLSGHTKLKLKVNLYILLPLY